MDGGGQPQVPAPFPPPPRNSPGINCRVVELTPGPVWTGVKKRKSHATTGVRTPYRPAKSESLPTKLSRSLCFILILFINQLNTYTACVRFAGYNDGVSYRRIAGRNNCMTTYFEGCLNVTRFQLQELPFQFASPFH